MNPLLKHSTLFLFVFICAISSSTCNNNSFTFCDNNNCSYNYLFPGVLTISGNENKAFFILTEKGVNKADFGSSKDTPFAYNYSSENGLVALKHSELNSIKISLFDIKKSKMINLLQLPDTVTSIYSGCFLKNNSLAMLFLEETNHLVRKYYLSISDKTDINTWDSFLLREENPDEFMENYMSLGAAFERPLSIQCLPSGIYINTVTSFSDMLQINIYRFDAERKKLVFETGYHPLDVSGKVSVFFNDKNSTAYIYQKRELITVRKNDFPVKNSFDEPGEVFFSPITKDGVIIFFVPEKNGSIDSKARIIKI